MNDLDAEELFHLALKASESGDREKTISFLKRSIDLDPKANSVYLLAAEYAELGMMQRAIDHMQQALELNPKLWTAYFQLGLLFLTQNLLQEARNAFAPLLDLETGPDEYLFHFGSGMTRLVNDEIEAALESLNRGLALNDRNPALNRDVTSIITSIANELAGNSPAAPEPGDQAASPLQAPPETAPAEEAAAKVEKEKEQKQHLFLANYGSGNDGS